MTTTGPGDGQVVLLVEDDDAVRRVACRFLERAGYRVMESADPTDAVEQAADASGPIHLLVTDVILPRMTGVQLAELVQRQRPGIRVLFMSGYDEEAAVRYGVREPRYPFVRKPLDMEQFLARVAEALR